MQGKASNRQGPRLRPSANESEGRMKHTEGQAHSEERAAQMFKGTRIREPRSRTARQQYRSHPTTWKKDLPQEESKATEGKGRQSNRSKKAGRAFK